MSEYTIGKDLAKMFKRTENNGFTNKPTQIVASQVLDGNYNCYEGLTQDGIANMIKESVEDIETSNIMDEELLKYVYSSVDYNQLANYVMLNHRYK